MLKSYRVLLGALLMFVAVLPAMAAEPVKELPAIKGYTSARFEMLESVNDMAFMVGRGQMENQNRVYYVLKALPVEDMPEATLEVILYDGTLYAREDTDPQWYIVDSGIPVGPPSLDDLPPTDATGVSLMKIGSTTIRGVATDQYQIWLNLDQTTYLKYDLWIGQNPNYLYQERGEANLTDPELGNVAVASLMGLYDFDAAIKVYPPENAKPYNPTSASLTGFSYAYPMVNKVIAPLATPQFRDRVVGLFGR